MKNLVKLLIASALLGGCATTHPGAMANQIGGEESLPLKVSAKNIKGDPGENFQMIEITIENTSNRWIKIDSAKALLGDPATSQMSVVLGRDLHDWAESMRLKREQEKYNKRLLQAGLLIGSLATAAVGSARGDSGLTLAGAAVAAGTEGWVLADVISNRQNTVNGVQPLPDNHLYQPFSVGGKLFLRRWILINKPAEMEITRFMFELQTVEGQKNVYSVKL